MPALFFVQTGTGQTQGWFQHKHASARASPKAVLQRRYFGSYTPPLGISRSHSVGRVVATWSVLRDEAPGSGNRAVMASFNHCSNCFKGSACGAA